MSSESSPTIRVMLVDDHDMVRRGLAVFLHAFPDLVLVGEASNGAEAVQRCGAVQPDVILMDMVMPEMDGPSAIRLIRTQYPHIHCIALTSYKDAALVQPAIRAGAISYLLKDVSIDEMAFAIREAYYGRSVLSQDATHALIASSQQVDTETFGLTDRELEVLALLVDGRTNPEIATALGVSRSTIKTHVSNILAKLNVTNRLEATRLALENNLVPSNPI